MSGGCATGGNLSGPRSRADAAARVNEVEPTPRPVKSGVAYSSPSMSQREKADRQASMSKEEQPTLLDKGRSTGMSHAVTFNQSVRTRLAIDSAKAESAPTVSSAADFYLAEWKAKRAAEAAEEAEQIKAGRLIRL